MPQLSTVVEPDMTVILRDTRALAQARVAMTEMIDLAFHAALELDATHSNRLLVEEALHRFRTRLISLDPVGAIVAVLRAEGGAR